MLRQMYPEIVGKNDMIQIEASEYNANNWSLCQRDEATVIGANQKVWEAS